MLKFYLKSSTVHSVRNFSSCSILQGKIRKILHKSINTPQNTKDLFRLKKEPTNPSKPKLERPITRQHAAHLLSKLTGEEVDMHTLGPLSNDDLRYFKVADKKIICALLGTTPNQLLDSVIVDRTVKSFLGRGQLEKALMTARLAKDKGTVAMNRIVEWVLAEGKVNDALQIHSTRKKWGVPLNEQSITILFDGCANIRDAKGGPGLSTNQVEKLKKVLLGLKPSYKFNPNMTHINSAFSALLNTQDQNIAFDLWREWSSKQSEFFKPFTPNAKTLTILLQALGHGPSDMWVMIQAEDLLDHIMKLPERLQDRKLFESYVFAYLRCSRVDFIERGFDAANKFFDIDSPKPTSNLNHRRLRAPDENITFMPIKDLSDKWIPSKALIDVLMKAYVQLGDYQSAMKVFKEFEENFPSYVDLPLIHRYLITLRDGSKSKAGEDSIELYKSIVEGTYRAKIYPTKATRFMVFNAIYTQSLTVLNDKGLYSIGQPAFHIFNLAENFFKLVEKDMTSYELLGYLKAIRRLRLTKSQRELVLERIQLVKKNFKTELEESTSKSDTQKSIAKVLLAEKDMKEKQEKKLILEKLDNENENVSVQN